MTYYVSKMFAVDNACEDLKKVVLKIVSSNNNDGVSEAIDILMGGEYEWNR